MLKIFEFLIEYFLMSIEGIRFKKEDNKINNLFALKISLVIIILVLLIFKVSTLIWFVTLLLFVVFYEEYLRGDWIHHRRKRIYDKLGIRRYKPKKAKGGENTISGE